MSRDTTKRSSSLEYRRTVMKMAGLTGFLGVIPSLASADLGNGRTPYVDDDEDDQEDSDYLNLADEVPQRALDLWERKPDVREAYNTRIVDSSYDNRAGDLTEEIEAAANNDEILDIGSGTYEMNTTVEVSSGIVGIVGDDATIHYVGTDLLYLFFVFPAEFVLEGVEFDITDSPAEGDDTDVGLVHCEASDQVWIEDITLSGSRHRWQDLDGDGEYETVGGRFTFRIDMTDPDGEAFIHRIDLPDGGTDKAAEIGRTVGHAIGPNADPSHEGYNVWKDCRAEGFMDNGFYVRNSPDGENVLWNCEARNNAAGNIRIGGGDMVIGGVAEVHNLPDGRSGQCLTISGDPDGHAHVIGLKCVASGDSWGDEIIVCRSDVHQATFEKLVMHSDSGRSFPVGIRGDPNEILIEDVYWYDEGEETSTLVELTNGIVESPDSSTFRVRSENNSEILVRDDVEFILDGSTVESGTYTADELGLGDPLDDHDGLPEFYFDYSAPDENDDDADGDNAPTVTQHEVYNANTNNPHAEIRVDWEVTDEDGDLDRVVSELYDGVGTRIDDDDTNVSGSSAHSHHDWDLMHSQDDTYEVVTTVTDGNGNEDTVSETLST